MIEQTKNTYPHSRLRPKVYFCKPVLLVLDKNTWLHTMVDKLFVLINT